MSHNLQTYLVGGAVRDQLLGIETKDRDWVVVGARPETLLDLGFKQVGKDFPVFLHPESREEYALARTERKSGKGYTGFICDASPEVSLEDDLKRRDLTINAMAKDQTGELIDPYGGLDDLNKKILRHVSPAFSEDPLRVLRTGRFYARFGELGFHIAPETLDLCEDLVRQGELEHLPAERVWQETQRALSEKNPELYFEMLKQVGALKVLFTELEALFGVPQPEQYHPEIDCGLHSLMSLKQACMLSDDSDVRFAALIHDLGKAVTPEEQWPKHFGHELKGLRPIKSLCKRIRAPRDHQDLALLVSEFHTHIHRADELRADTVLKVLKRCDAYRKPERFEKILLCCIADARGRTGFEKEAYPQADLFRSWFDASTRVDIKSLVAEGLGGAELGKRIDEERCRLISQLKGR